MRSQPMVDTLQNIQLNNHFLDLFVVLFQHQWEPPVSQKKCTEFLKFELWQFDDKLNQY
ncbi:hypothetical protein X975_04568, partial [Stegodyphus mimosarum]